MGNLGKILKIFLIVAFLIAIPAMFGLPFIMNHMNRVNAMIIIYPNGILILGFTYQFIGMFKYLE